MADYATRLLNLYNEAEAAFKAEKQAITEAGRAVDAKWRFLDLAQTKRRECLALAHQWIAAEENRLKVEAAKRANEIKQDAEALGEINETVEQVPIPKIKLGHAATVSKRSRVVGMITDLPAFAAYLASMNDPPPDFVEVCEKIANRLVRNRVPAPGLASKKIEGCA